MKKIYMLLVAVLLMVMAGCGGGDSSSPPSSAKAITAFSLNGIDGSINEMGKIIEVTMPPETDLTALVATFATTGASVKVGSIAQTSGDIIDYFKDTDEVTYTVTAADGSTENYIVKVTVSTSLSGFLDKDFGTGGKVTTPVGSGDDRALALGIQPNRKIVVAGYSYNGSNYDFALVRYNEDGTLDSTFGTSGIVTTSVGSGDDAAYALCIQLDRKIVVVGYSYNGSNNDFALVRYNEDGTLDTTFGTAGKVTTPIGSYGDIARAVCIQSNGKIVTAGISYNGSNNDFALVRYNEDGTLDLTFGSGGKVTTSVGSSDDYATALGIQSSGKLVVSGYSYNGSNNDFALVRYNEDGTLDTTFGTGGKVTTPVGSLSDIAIALYIQSDNKILAAGNSFNGSSNDFALVRHNEDGTLDSTFGTGGKVTTSVGSIENAATALGIQSSNKIVAAGYSYNGSHYDFALVRYNTDGSLDTDFGIGGKVTTPIGSKDDYATALGIQSDDKIVAAGISDNDSNDDFALVRYLP